MLYFKVQEDDKSVNNMAKNNEEDFDQEIKNLVDETENQIESNNETDEINDQLGFEIASWETPEYQRHDRPGWWYIVYALVAIGLIIIALVTNNFLFGIIIIISSFVILLHDARNPQPVLISLTTEGIIVGNQFYDYDEIKQFAIVYKPSQNLKRLYFEFKSTRKHRLSLALHETNPLYLREHLLKYVPEDLERTDEPLSEFLSRVLKL